MRGIPPIGGDVLAVRRRRFADAAADDDDLVVAVEPCDALRGQNRDRPRLASQRNHAPPPSPNFSASFIAAISGSTKPRSSGMPTLRWLISTQSEGGGSPAWRCAR